MTKAHFPDEVYDKWSLELQAAKHNVYVCLLEI